MFDIASKLKSNDRKTLPIFGDVYCAPVILTRCPICLTPDSTAPLPIEQIFCQL